MADVAFYAQKHGIPLKLANALIGQESGGNPNAVSPVGATGITQVMPSTAAGMYDITVEKARVLLRNPDFALDAGFKYLAAQKKTFGTWRLALAAYNAGPNAVRKYNGVPPYRETQGYVTNILGVVGGEAAVGDPPSGVASPPPDQLPLTSPTAPPVIAPRAANPFGASVESGLFALSSGSYRPSDRVREMLGLAGNGR